MMSQVTSYQLPQMLTGIFFFFKLISEAEKISVAYYFIPQMLTRVSAKSSWWYSFYSSFSFLISWKPLHIFTVVLCLAWNKAVRLFLTGMDSYVLAGFYSICLQLSLCNHKILYVSLVIFILIICENIFMGHFFCVSFFLSPYPCTQTISSRTVNLSSYHTSIL